MSEAGIIALIQFGIRFGLDAAIAIARAFKRDATIEDAVAALELAKTKTAQDYLREDREAHPKAKDA